MSTSPSPGPSGTPTMTPSSSTSTNRHALSPSSSQRAQLDKLLKNPVKPVYIPSGTKEKEVRAPREMMKNVQGSSAGAGSGEFHVYKASRRREYERLKIMDEKVKRDAQAQEFEEQQRKWREDEESKTAKNRAKRQKKKERGRQGGGGGNSEANSKTPGKTQDGKDDVPLKKRRLVNGAEMVFKRPGEDDAGDEDERRDVGPRPQEMVTVEEKGEEQSNTAPAATTAKLTIIDDE